MKITAENVAITLIVVVAAALLGVLIFFYVKAGRDQTGYWNPIIETDPYGQKSKVGYYLKDGDNQLVVECIGGSIDVWISPLKVVAVSPEVAEKTATIDVAYKANSDPYRQANTWTRDQDNYLRPAPEHKTGFLEYVADNPGRLVVDLTDDNDNPHTYSWNETGRLSKVLELLAPTCDVPMLDTANIAAGVWKRDKSETILTYSLHGDDGVIDVLCYRGKPRMLLNTVGVMTLGDPHKVPSTISSASGAYLAFQAAAPADDTDFVEVSPTDRRLVATHILSNPGPVTIELAGEDETYEYRWDDTAGIGAALDGLTSECRWLGADESP